MASSQATLRRSPLAEVVENWKESCLRPHPSGVGPGGSSTITSKSATDLQQDAKTFFRYISKNTQTDALGGGRLLKTRSSHEEVLAQLIQQLGPAFQTSRSQRPRLRALHLLLGALEGCQSTGSTATMSNTCLRLVGNFLTVHCGPIDVTIGESGGGEEEEDDDDDDLGDDLETSIRDTAVRALSALIEITPSLTPTPATAEQQESDTSRPVVDPAVEAIELRIVLAQTGVEKRCALPDDGHDDANMDMGYGDDNARETDIRGGLSTLPRSKRSLCFTMLRCSVKGVSHVTNIVLKLEQQTQNPTLQPASISSTDDEHVRRFLIRSTKFASRCIIGESDPRCLLQLLELLHAVQSSFWAWFGDNSMPADQVFPNEDVFDAVAPYYPIQFTPPPNNPHGITREGLHFELLAVLTCTQMDATARHHRKPTMLSQTFNLFLEPLLPADDEAPTLQEKFEALESLTKLLFPSSGPGESRNLTVDEVQALSSAMQLTHDDAARGVSIGGEKGEQNKILADQCRTFISTVALDLEKNDVTNNLCRAFVVAPLDKDMKKIKLSPSYCKTSIAYAACLAASGGPKTLRSCLSKGLQPLIEYLEDNQDDTEDAVASIHGCAAFFSSCHVAIEKSNKDGVRLYPHPLEPYAAQSCSLLLAFTERKDADYSWSIKLALATSLQCLLDTATAEQLGVGELPSRICVFFSELLQAVSSFDLPDMYQQDYVRYMEMCSMTLGTVVGKCASDTKGNVPTDQDSSEGKNLDDILHTKQIEDYINSHLLPGLMDSCMNDKLPQNKNRFDRRALSIACSFSTALADSVVQTVLKSLLDAVRMDLTDPSVGSALVALSSIIRNSRNHNALLAFHASEIPDEILTILSTDLIPAGKIQRKSLAQLALPETSDEHQKTLLEVSTAAMIEFVSCCRFGKTGVAHQFHSPFRSTT
jgi:Dos2-interacting transcription regulator of RNA-Pol-II